MKTYLVGGAVRDELLGLPIGDRDWVVVGASMEEMLEMNFTPVGKFFPVFLHPKTKEEYALARIERKVSGGYHGFTFDTSNVTLEQDLQRRDLTINAIAKTPEGDFIDPYGGQEDLKQKVLRHISPAFEEDPVRVLRVARFAARFAGKGFHVAPETIDLMKEMGKKGELDFLVAERVWKELFKALTEPMPVAFLQVLRQCEALKIIFPEINPGIHNEKVLYQATKLSKDPQVRFAALLAKEEGVLKLCERLRVPNDFQSLAKLVNSFHIDCHNVFSKTPAQILDLLERCDAFRRHERFKQMLLACEADFRGRPEYENIEYRQSTFLSLAFAAAQDVDVQSIVKSLISPQGEAIKEAIHAARLAAISAIKAL